MRERWKMDERKLLSGVEELSDVLSELSLGNLDVVLGLSLVVHEVEETGRVEADKRSQVGVGWERRRGDEEGRKGRRAHPSSTLTSWNSCRRTMGASMLWVEGEISSSFLKVKIYREDAG